MNPQELELRLFGADGTGGLTGEIRDLLKKVTVFEDWTKQQNPGPKRDWKMLTFTVIESAVASATVTTLIVLVAQACTS